MLKGSESLHAYKDTVSNTRSFCGNYGPPLLITDPDHPGVTIVASGTLDEALELRPNVEFHCKQKTNWLGDVEGAERFDSMP